MYYRILYKESEGSVMDNVFITYLYVCGVIISIIVVVGLIAVLLNVMIYAYETFIGINTFKKFLRKYHTEMRQEKYKVK